MVVPQPHLEAFAVVVESMCASRTILNTITWKALARFSLNLRRTALMHCGTEIRVLTTLEILENPGNF